MKRLELKIVIVKMLPSLPFSESRGAARTKGRAAAFLFFDLMKKKYKRSVRNNNIKILFLRGRKGKSRRDKLSRHIVRLFHQSSMVSELRIQTRSQNSRYSAGRSTENLDEKCSNI